MNRLYSSTLTVLCLLIICFGSFLLAEDGEDFFNEGKKFFKKKQYSTAIEMFDAAIEENDSYWEAMTWKIKTFGKQKNVSAQIDACYNTLKAMDEKTDLSDKDKRLKRKIQKQVAKLDKAGIALRALVDDYIAEAIELGNKAMSKKNYTLARKIFQKILELDPENLEAKNMLGSKYLKVKSTVELFDGKVKKGWIGDGNTGNFWKVKDGRLIVTELDDGITTLSKSLNIEGNYTISGDISFLQLAARSSWVGFVIADAPPRSGLKIILNGKECRAIKLDYFTKPSGAIQRKFGKLLAKKQIEIKLELDKIYPYEITISENALKFVLADTTLIDIELDSSISTSGQFGVTSQDSSVSFGKINLIQD